MTAGELFLHDVLDIPESVHTGDFKVELSQGFLDTEARVGEYVVTDQLRQAFSRAPAPVLHGMRDRAVAAPGHPRLPPWPCLPVTSNSTTWVRSATPPR